MFNNFIYFIIALLIYITGPIEVTPYFSAFQAIFMFIGLTLLLVFSSRRRFGKIEQLLNIRFVFNLEHQFNAALNRQSITAIILFAVNIYGLNLPSLLDQIGIFNTVPTLSAIICLSIFTFYLAIVWYYAYSCYQRLYSISISRTEYIVSNISFVFPVLLPWIVISSLIDLINILPFEGLKQFLESVEGQLIFFLAFLFILAIIGPAIVKKFWRCKPLEPGYNRSRIEYLCQRAGMKYKDILYWPFFGGRMITAGVMGLVHQFRYILVTKALLSILTPEEVDSVIAHEIGHVKRYHIVYYLLFFIGLSVFFIIAHICISIILIAFFSFTNFFSDQTLFLLESMYSVSRSAGSGIFSMIITVVLFIIYFRYIFGFFIRNFERQADAYVFSLFNSSQPLIRTFEKIILNSGQSADQPNWHHYSINERIDFLQKCEADRSWIARHDQKVRIGFVVYLVGFIMLGLVGYQLRYGSASDFMIKGFMQKYEQRIYETQKKHADNPELLSEIGNLFYNRKEYAKAISAWSQALALSPDNAIVLNNLAWVYATCEELDLRDPERAVELAEKAASIMETDYIVDTLAESYYAVGRYQEALTMGKKALELATSKAHRTEFQEKLQRYKQGLVQN